MRRALFALLMVAQPALAANLTITKTATVISDPLNNLIPRAVPGAVVDYKILFTNPIGNVGQPVRNIQTDDTLPANVALRVSDLAAAGKGPIEFIDGSLLGLGLGGSGLTCPFTSLSSTSDCVDFSDGSSWNYTPVPDADGYDANVRAIRIKPGTTFSTSGSFQVRFRVKIR